MRRLCLPCLVLVACSSHAESAGGPSDGGGAADSGVVNQAIVLASEQDKPWTLALDDGNVYWLSSGARGGVYKLSKTGGVPVALYEGTLGNIESIAVDASSVYFPLPEAIAAVPVGGGPLRVLASAKLTHGVAVAHDQVYWIEDVGPAPQSRLVARRVSVSGGPPTEIPLPDLSRASQFAYFTIAADDAVYASLAPGGGILRLPFDDGAATVLSVPEANGVGFDRDGLYFTGRIGVNAISKTGTDLRQLANVSASFALAVDESFVYFTEHGPAGRVLRVGKADGVASTLAANQGAPHAVVVDSTSVYWNCIDEGTIKKLAK